MSGPRFEKFSVFFPMWNEEEYLQRALNAATELGDELIAQNTVADYEMIIVNDASTDATAQLADEAAAANRRVVVVHHPVNRKLGGSIKSGFAAATGDVVLYTDADLPFDFREVHKAMRLMNQYEADIVAAYRFDRTGEGYVRVVYSFFYNLLVRALFGCRFRDVNFAFKLVRRSVLQKVELTSEGSFIDAELMVSARKLGMNVVQFGVDYFPRTRGVSTLSSPSVIVKILKEAWALRSHLNALAPKSK
jgi:glycosyltransferase involved in cell wall biosynthesis